MEETIVISLGGSLIVPDQVDTEFLREFKALVLSHVEKGKKFAIITGGGRTARKYQEASKQLVNTAQVDLDWIGIAALRLNAELVRVIFEDKANKKVIEDLGKPFDFNTPVVIGSAEKPGWSTDYDAVLAAKTLGAKKVINLSNADHVYDSDPRTNPNAKKFDTISWAEYRSIIPKEWSSGLHTPFDPIASKLAEEIGLEVVIMNGRPIDNLKNYLDGEKFVGTIIS